MTRQMTTDLSSCVDDRLPEFPWEDVTHLSEQGPSYGRYDYVGPNVTDFTAPLNSHIQALSLRMGTNCGEPNTETAVLTILESTSQRGETYQERPLRVEVYPAGKN